MFMKYILIFLIGLLFSSCALVFSGTRDKITVHNGTPPNAKVFYNGSYKGTAPMRFSINKRGLKKGHEKIEIKADGYETQTVVFSHKIKGFALFGDVITGLIWLIPDFVTGAIYKASPPDVRYNLSRK